MFRRLSLASVVILCAVSVSAQTVAADFIIPPELLADFPEQYQRVGTIDPLQGVTSRPIDADGNPATEDWLLHFGVAPGQDPALRPAWQEWYRVVAVRGPERRICAGPWFKPHNEPITATLTLTQANGRHVFIVNWSARFRWPLMSDTFVTQNGVRIVTLDAPSC